MPLSIALVFHFNQHTNEHADIANRACYRGLLTVLRGRPKLKFNLHLSGTLLRSLAWFDMETIELVRAGLADGQFELLGSTYAQNVPYASDDWDNAEQIVLHRAVLEELFGVKPAAFWISERSWRQSLLPVIATGGYTVVPIEDHVLEAAGAPDPAPARTALGEQSLIAVRDDVALRDRFNFAAWFGRRAQLHKYLQGYQEREGADDFWLTYAEDAEAMGLWGWEKGYLPQAVWANLDNLLSEIEASDQYVTRHLSEARAKHSLGPLPDAAARWMDSALVRPDAPYHEDGYTDWFDFLARSPKLVMFRNLYDVVRQRLQALAEARAETAGTRAAGGPGDTFFRQAVEAFCHHQYEFGCIGIGGRGYWGWENARSAFTLARAAELADAPRVGVWIEDVNGDGSDEQLFCNGKELAVFTSHGGRLLYWFNLETGREWVGNQLAVPPAKFDIDASKAPQVKVRVRRWLPDTFAPNAKPWQDLKQKEAAPTRMGRHLPRWVFEGEPAELPVYVLPAEGQTRPTPLLAQTGALTDVIRVDAGPETPVDNLLDFRFADGAIIYLRFPAPDVLVEKRVWQEPGGLRVRYSIDNRDEVEHKVVLKSGHELSPDYAQALPVGRSAYRYFRRPGHGPAVRNDVTGTTLVLQLQPSAPAEMSPNLLALNVELTYKLDLAPRTQVELELALRALTPGPAEIETEASQSDAVPE